MSALIALILLNAGHLAAQSAGQDAERQLRLQQERLEEFRRQQQEVQRQRVEKDRLNLPPETRYQSSGEQKHCFPIYALDLRGDNSLLTEKKLNKLSQNFFGYCVGIDQINQLVEKLTRYYFDLGYVTTRIYLPQQDLSSGTLRLEVVPGRVESVQFSSPEKNRHLSLLSTMPLRSGDLFNLRSLDQGLDQLNRLSSNKATVGMAPGEEPGDSRVLIDNQPSRRYRASFGYDNSGDQSTGRSRSGHPKIKNKEQKWTSKQEQKWTSKLSRSGHPKIEQKWTSKNKK